MAREFHLSVVAPDKSVVEEQATSMVVPGTEGYFGVMAGHVPLIAALRPGLLEFADKVGTRHFVYIGGGECAGLVLGARVPIVLTSRADSLTARLASVALAMLAAPDRLDGAADRREMAARANAAVPDAALRSDPAITGSAA